MRKMKDSGIEWIGQIPEEWNTVRLKYVVKPIKSGGTPDSDNEQYYSDNGIAWVSISDMSMSDYIFDTQKHITEVGRASKQLTIYPKGTLLYSIYATVGKVSELKTPACINQAILAISPRGEKYLTSFMKYSLKSIEDYVLSQSSGNTQFNLNTHKVNNLVVCMPSLVMQQCIVDYLDEKCGEIDRYIEKQQKIIEKLKAYKQAVITEAVTKGLDPTVPMKDSGIEWIGMIPAHWSVAKLANLFSFIGGYAFNSDTYVPETNNQIIRIGNVKNDLLLFDSNPVYISDDFAKQVERFRLQVDDILFTMTGTKGKRDYFYTLIIDSSHLQTKELYLNQRVGCFRKKGEISPAYYNYLLKDSRILDSIFLYETGTANQGNLGIETINRTKVHLPPYEEQIAIALHLSKKCEVIDKAISKTEDIINCLTEYKKSLIYEAVTGKLEV